MTELRPWAGFDSLVDGLERLHSRAREAAVRSVDEILTGRNWLIGAWIVAYEQEGADRARVDHVDRNLRRMEVMTRARG